MSATLDSAATAGRGAAHTRKGPVVVAVEEEGAHVIQTAVALAPVIGDQIHVFSVVEPLSVEVFAGEPVLIPAALDDERRYDRIERVTAQVTAAAGPGHHWNIDVEHGYPTSDIVERARQLDASLILMGLGRHKPLDRLIGAETTLRVIQRASCPVLAIANPLGHSPSEVVVATDFSPESALAAQCAISFLQPGAMLRLVHVWEPSHTSDQELRDIEMKYAATLSERFEHLIAALDVPVGINVTYEVREGKTVPQLLAYTESHDGDMIVAGRHGLGRIARLFVGSVTTALVRAATCAVLVMPEASFAQLDRWKRVLEGTSASESPADWARQLAEFTKRNKGRRTALEVDDPMLGAQTQAIGYELVGATYDPRDARVELMFGASRANASHLTRSIGHVDSVAVLCAPNGEDMGLRIAHGQGQTLLTFPHGP